MSDDYQEASAMFSRRTPSPLVRPDLGPATRKVIDATAETLRHEQREPKRFRDAQQAIGLSDKEAKAFLAEQEQPR